MNERCQLVMGRLPPLLAPGSTSAMPVRASRRPTKVPQVFALRAHHKEPTDETGLGGTRRHCRYDGAVGPLTSTYAGELGLSRCLRDHGLNGDGTPEKRKVGGSTPPLTTRTRFDLRKRRLRNGRWLRSSAGPDAVMSVAARRPPAA